MGAMLAVASSARAATKGLSERERLEDLDVLWRGIDEGYAYFGATGRREWKGAREPSRRAARAARTREQFLAALEGQLARLRDDHVWISERAPDSPRRVPSETDIWAAWRNEAAVIEAVRTYGEADVAGLRPGHVVRGIAGLPAPLAVRDQLGAGEAGAAARDWALRHALAGPRGGVLRIEVAEAQGPRSYEVERRAAPAANGPALVARRVGEARDLGYVRLKAPLSDAALAARFDGALNYLRDTRGLILDLRDLTGPFEHPGRARASTLAMLKQFSTRGGAWQVRESRTGERIADAIPPAPEAYAAPLVVLVDRWTAGEGEAFAGGLHAVAGARLIGTKMAGLRGELRELQLPHSGVAVRFPGQKSLLADGTPRESLRPGVLVDLAAPQGGPGDPILYQGLTSLARYPDCPARACRSARR